VLFEPEIPQNTGNIARTCAALGCTLHLIEPLGFSLEDKYLRRAGLDYWPMVDVKCYSNLEAFFETNSQGNYFYLTKKAKQSYHEAEFKGKTYFFFGKETWGLPASLISRHWQNCLRIPMQENARSLNLSNAVALVLYEAFRQNNFPGLRIYSDQEINHEDQR